MKLRLDRVTLIHVDVVHSRVRVRVRVRRAEHIYAARARDQSNQGVASFVASDIISDADRRGSEDAADEPEKGHQAAFWLLYQRAANVVDRTGGGVTGQAVVAVGQSRDDLK